MAHGFEDLGFQPHDDSAAAAPAGAPQSHGFEDLGFQPHDDAPAAPAKEASPESQMKDSTKRFNDREDAKGKAFIDSLTMGHYPQIKAKMDQMLAGEGYSNDENYVKRRDSEIAKLKQESEDNPLGTAVARIGGAVAPMVATGGTAAPAEAIEGVPFVTRLGRSMLKSAAYGAGYGAASNPGDVEGKVDPLQLKERAEGAYEGGKFGAEMGFAIPVAAEAIGAAPKIGRYVAQKAGKIFTPVSEETTARYLDNPEAINKAPSREDISNNILNLKKEADAGVQKATDDLQSARQGLSESKVDTRSGLADEKFQAQSNHAEATANFNEKKQQFKEALKNNNLTQMAGEVQSAHEELGKKVSQASTEGFEILGNDPNVKVDVDPLMHDTLQKHVSGQFINGVAKSPEAGKTAQALKDWQQRLFDMTKKTDGMLSGPQAKELMQELDKVTQYDQSNSGPGQDKLNKALKDLRSQLNQAVRKQSPAYAEHMDTVTAPMTQLLEKSEKLYGTPEKAIQNLNNLDSEKGKALHVPVLQQLEAATGKNLKEPVAGYLMNQHVLNNPSAFDEIMNDTAEAKQLAGAKNRLSELANPEYSRNMSESATAPASQKLSAAEQTLGAAKEKAGQYSGITENSVFSKTKAVDGANSFGPEKQIERIDKANGTNFREQIQNRNDADQFAKSDAHGSRKTVFGSVLGGASGWLLGHNPEVAALGAAAGAHAGAALDKYSGQIFKKTLDAGRVAGRISDSVYQGLSNIRPEKVTEAVLRYSSANKGPEKWAFDGFGKLMDHASKEEREALGENFDRLVKSKKGRDLLVSASDLKPHSKQMDDVFQRVKFELESGEE